MNIDFQIIGYIAGFLGIICGLPQFIKVMGSSDTTAISLTTYLIMLADIIFWIAYGFMIDDRPIIISNIIIAPFFLFIICRKIDNLKNKVDIH